MSDITETFEELKSEARDLGINVKSIKSKKDMKEAIDTYYENHAADGLVNEVEEATEDLKTKVDSEDTTEVEVDDPIKNKKEKTATDGHIGETYKEIMESKPNFSTMSKEQAKREAQKYHARLKAFWMGKRIVTITNNDKRENSHATMAFISAGVIQRQVPLDIPVELERCLIKVAQEIVITSHVDEIINGQRTGNKTPIVIKKYGVSLQDNEL